jgi:RNA polymerase sigma-70 factor (ECF subfamily)
MDQVTKDVLLAQDGDDAAFARFVATTEVDVRRFCSWFTRPGHDIDDLVQETFLRAFRGLHSFSGRSTATAWLLTIARRACLDLAERRRRDESIVAGLSSLSVLSSSIESVCDLGADIVGTLLLEELPEPFREAFILVRIFGFGYDEVAEILACPRGTVQSRVARARVMLATAVEAASNHEAVRSDAS